MNGDFSSDATVNGYGNVKDNLMDKETSYYARNRPKPKKHADKHRVVSRLENIKFMYFQSLYNKQFVLLYYKSVDRV
jgi:hypothetical protein